MAVVLQGHALSENVGFVRFGLFLVIAGLALLVSSVRASRQESRRQGAGAQQADDRP
jgi:hypothetical protein